MDRTQDLLYCAFDEAQTFTLGAAQQTNGERVHQLLACSTGAPELFIESSEYDNEREQWNQTARWIRYKEVAELAGHRWGKPHVGLLSVACLFKVRICLRRGTTIFDTDDTSFVRVIDSIIENGLAVAPGRLQLGTQLPPVETEKVHHSHAGHHKDSQQPVVHKVAVGRQGVQHATQRTAVQHFFHSLKHKNRPSVPDEMYTSIS